MFAAPAPVPVYARVMDDENGGREGEDSLVGRVQARGEQAVGELADALLENPVFSQALGAAFGARDKALGAQRVAMEALDLPSATGVERLERRLRSLSERLEAVEGELDRVTADLRAMREAAATEDPATPPA